MEPGGSSVLERATGGARDDGETGLRRWTRPPSSRRAVARLVQFVGLVGTVFAVLPPRHHRFSLLADMVPIAGMLTARAAIAVIGVLLIYLGAGLRRGCITQWKCRVRKGVRSCRSRA